MDKKYSVHDICEIKEKLIDATKAEFAKGIACVHTQEMGAVIDMIKDLAKAEKDCYEACFYKEVVEAMDDFEDKEEAREWYMQLFSGRPGYDHYRYASGRFAPKGHGHRMGYDWNRMQMPRTVPDMPGEDMRHGRAYNQYMDALRHYTETKSDKDRMEMSEHAKEHIADTVETMRDIWHDADPDLRKKMKAELTSLLGEMS